MPVGVEGADVTGRKVVTKAKLLKCPMILPGRGCVGARGPLRPALRGDPWHSRRTVSYPPLHVHPGDNVPLRGSWVWGPAAAFACSSLIPT